MAVILFPRLSAAAVDRIFEQLLSGQTKGPATQALPDEASFGATGGSRVESVELVRIRNELLKIAAQCGYPKKNTTKTQAAFDSEASAWLAGCESLASGEAMRDDVWAFLTTALLQDIALWRFGAVRARFHGGVRNTFQRLHMRGIALDRGVDAPDRWLLLHELTEDAFVQIIERPAIAANRSVALPLGEAWLRTARQIGRGKMEDVMREATIRLRLLSEVRQVSALPRDELDALLDTIFRTAFTSRGVEV